MKRGSWGAYCGRLTCFSSTVWCGAARPRAGRRGKRFLAFSGRNAVHCCAILDRSSQPALQSETSRVAGARLPDCCAAKMGEYNVILLFVASHVASAFAGFLAFRYVQRRANRQGISLGCGWAGVGVAISGFLYWNLVRPWSRTAIPYWSSNALLQWGWPLLHIVISCAFWFVPSALAALVVWVSRYRRGRGSQL